MPISRLSILFPGVLVLAGCGTGTDGALGQAAVTQSCPPTDFSCATSGVDAPVARGASLDIEVTLTFQGSGAPPLHIASANEDVFTVRDSALDALDDGVATALVLDPDDGVLDFFSVFVESATSVFLHRLYFDGSDLGPAPDTIELIPGDELRLAPVPFANEQRLLGRTPIAWKCPGDVLTVLDQGEPGLARFVARKTGETTISAEAFGRSVDVRVKVLP